MRGLVLLTAVLGAFVWCLSDTIREPEAGAMEASYYGEELRGSPTASGEPFDPDGFTAAHKTLPIGTNLRVCKEACTTVRVNDRGPFVGGRDLDLSEGAAESIGLKDEGTAPVEVQQTSSEPVEQLPKTGGVI